MYWFLSMMGHPSLVESQATVPFKHPSKVKLGNEKVHEQFVCIYKDVGEW